MSTHLIKLLLRDTCPVRKDGAAPAGIIIRHQILVAGVNDARLGRARRRRSCCSRLHRCGRSSAATADGDAIILVSPEAGSTVFAVRSEDWIPLVQLCRGDASTVRKDRAGAARVGHEVASTGVDDAGLGRTGRRCSRLLRHANTVPFVAEELRTAVLAIVAKDRVPLVELLRCDAGAIGKNGAAATRVVVGHEILVAGRWNA